MSAPGRRESRERFARHIDAAISAPDIGDPPTNEVIGACWGIAGPLVREVRAGQRTLAADRIEQLPGPVLRPLLERIMAAHPDSLAGIEHEHSSDAMAVAIASMGQATSGLALVVLHASARDPSALSAQLSAVVRDIRRVQAHLEKQRPANDTVRLSRSKRS